MKIKSIMIENFRIFRGKHRFDFSEKQLVLISGPNGNGKSTLFDAISWCTTGKLTRYLGSNEKNKFNYIVNIQEYNSGIYNTRVKIELQDEENITSIERRVCHNKSEKVFINGLEFGVQAGNGEIAKLLTKLSLEEEETEDGSEVNVDLNTLFSFTQILSQDTLNDFVRSDKPNERFKKLEKILGLKKYGENFKKYLDTTRSLVQHKIESEKRDKKVLEHRLEIVNTEINEKSNSYKNLGLITEEKLQTNINVLFNKYKELYNPNYSIVEIDVLDRKVRGTLLGLKQQLSDSIKNNEYIKKRIFKLKEHDIKRFLQFNRIEDGKKQEIESLKSKKKKRINGIKVGNDKVYKLKIIQDKKKLYTEWTDDINKAVKNIEDISIYEENFYKDARIKRIQQEYSTIDQFHKVYLLKQEQLQDILKCFKVHEKTLYIEQLDNTERELNAKEKQYNLELEHLKKQLSDIDAKLKSVYQKVNSTTKDELESIILRIQKSLIDNESKTSCVVCGNPFDSHKELITSIEEQRAKALIELDEINLEKVKHEASYGELQSKYRELNKSFGENNKLIQKNAEEKVKFYQEKEELLLVIKDRQLLLKNKKELDSLKNIVEDFIKTNQEVYQLIQQKYKIDQLVESYEETIKVCTKNLKDLMLNSGKHSVYLQGEPIRLKNKITLLENYISAAAINKDFLEQEIQFKLKELVDFQNKYSEIQTEISEIKKFIPDFEMNAELNEELKKINHLIFSMNEYNKEINDLLENLNSFIERDNYVNLVSEQSSISQNVLKKEELLQKYSIMIRRIEQLSNIQQNMQSNLLGEYLLKHSTNIDRFFRQISPHAIYKHVHLKTHENGLFILLDEVGALQASTQGDNYFTPSKEEMKREINASLTFSSAQSTILALCIFLSVNISEEWSKLKLIGIDDPFQNLDDVNIYSFVDVLTQIIIHEQKQVFISTHNPDFSKLVSAKIGIDLERISEISFISYDKYGVNISCSEYERLES
ncbi:SMC family ATPase [Bacillus cereus]|uniref:SMC family ATPase n=1 Tax=Bacillus cereus TaxID=1396 RepID=UPI002AC28FE7|nr:SMC family ATPase [Bacillus cereus]MDZ4496020.1 SMC family ATPase [Bacillus cereus]